jgi:hypothetical protein
VTSLALTNRLFRTLFSCGDRKSWAVRSPDDTMDAPRPSHCAWQGIF